VYQDRELGSGLSVLLSVASGVAIPFTASRRAVLSCNRQAPVLISSMLPPLWKAS
jgi:hypothetical protein